MKRSNEQPQEYKTFEDLEVYQVAREFRAAMYNVARRLPEIEKFGMAGRVRRAALSLTNNIAEGHGRFHFLEQVKFMLNSRGSLEELMDDLNACQDESYLDMREIEALGQEAWRLHKLINGYIRFLRSRNSEGAPRVQETQDDGQTEDDLETWLSVRFNPSTLQPFSE